MTNERTGYAMPDEDNPLNSHFEPTRRPNPVRAVGSPADMTEAEDAAVDELRCQLAITCEHAPIGFDSEGPWTPYYALQQYADEGPTLACEDCFGWLLEVFTS